MPLDPLFLTRVVLNHYPFLALGVLVTLAAAHVAVLLGRRRWAHSRTLSDMHIRSASLATALAFGLPLLALPAGATAIGFCAVGLLVLNEYSTTLAVDKLTRVRLLLFVGLPALTGLTLCAWPLLAVAALAAGALHLSLHPPWLTWPGVLLCCIGMGSLAVLVQTPANGFELMLLVLLVSQVSDTFQYLVGRRLGRTPFAPRISPRKTVEGLAGGLLVATAVGAALSSIWGLSPGQAALLSLQTAVLGVLSGLLLSAVKRQVGAKDWGTMLPGHGGLLDRLDSVLFAAPVLWLESALRVI